MDSRRSVTAADKRTRFGRRLREIRLERGMTQERLAEAANVERKLIYRTELAVTSPSLDHVFAIAEALEVEPAELFR